MIVQAADVKDFGGVPGLKTLRGLQQTTL